MKFSTNVNNKKCAPKIIFFNEFFWGKDSDIFWHRKLTLKVRILPFLKAFVQLSARLKNFWGGWLLVLSIKESLVKCATVCVKSVVILMIIHMYLGFQFICLCYPLQSNLHTYLSSFNLTFYILICRVTKCHTY